MLKPISEQSVNRFTALVIGPAGIGKTSLLRTIPEGDRACVLSAEGGLLCVQDLVRAGRVEGYEIGSFQDMKEAYGLFLMPEFSDRYKWVFIDSLTEISGRCVETMKAKYPSSDKTFKMWDDYNESMTQIIKGFRDLFNYSVVFTCLPSVEKDENNRRYTSAAIAGKQIQERLTSYFDEVFYMDSSIDSDGNSFRFLLTQPTEKTPGKDRSGKLETYEAPNLETIKSKIIGG